MNALQIEVSKIEEEYSLALKSLMDEKMQKLEEALTRHQTCPGSQA